MIGRLAAQDQYALDELPDVGAPLVGSGGQFSAGLPAVNRAADVASKIPGHMLGSVLSLPQRAIENSQYALDTGNYDPAVPVEAALNTMGMGAIASTPLRGGEIALGSGPIRAYHSSPHDFDKFDLAKIGTGEGAQVYGHGLYFAESPAVSGQGGQYWNQFKNRFSGADRGAASTFQKTGFDREQAAALTRTDIEQARRMLKEGFGSMQPGDPRIAQALATKEAELRLLESGAPVGPRTYEVNIKADPAHMLDWDKPLSAQQHLIDPLREAGVSRSLLNEASGGDLYHKAAIDFHRPGLGHLDRALASEKFAEAGIPGIKYLDQGSRAAGTGSSNYVIFDPGIIDIMKKYGLAGAAPAGLGALAAQDQYQP